MENENLTEQEIKIEETPLQELAKSEKVNEVLKTTPDTSIRFELDKNKSVNEQAKDIVALSATAQAVQDKELVDAITSLKKEELKTNAEANLKQEQVESSKIEKDLQHANYGTYEGIADLIGLKKPLPNKMLKVLMIILMPLLIIYYTIFGFVTGVINITMDCVNSVTERFATFSKSARKIIIFVGLLAIVAAVLLVIKYFLNKYGIINR